MHKDGTSSAGSRTGAGGLGGYSVGTFKITSSTNIYIVVGGKGYVASSDNTGGGYNGGGHTLTRYATQGNPATGGGGATHIGLKSSVLTGYSSDYSNQLLLVAGGGGGGNTNAGYTQQSYSDYNNGGAGGGTSGAGNTNTGLNDSSIIGYGNSTGGTQNSGGTGANGAENGTFGKGGTAGGDSTGFCGSGGGGGFYGGGAGANSHAGAGGSGYVNISKLTSAQTTSGNQSFPSPTSSSNETGHSGNGYARITPVN